VKLHRRFALLPYSTREAYTGFHSSVHVIVRLRRCFHVEFAHNRNVVTLSRE
jgi:hypothetical protein